MTPLTPRPGRSRPERILRTLPLLLVRRRGPGLSIPSCSRAAIHAECLNAPWLRCFSGASEVLQKSVHDWFATARQYRQEMLGALCDEVLTSAVGGNSYNHAEREE